MDVQLMLHAVVCTVRQGSLLLYKWIGSN